MPEPSCLKCRFCNYRVLRFYRPKNGKTRHGHAKLQHHVIEAHYFADKTSGRYGPYREVLLKEQADWMADPATLEEDYDEDHLLPMQEQA